MLPIRSVQGVEDPIEERIVLHIGVGRELRAGELLDSADLAAAVSAGFVGIELLHGVDPRSAELAFASLDRLNSLITTVNGLAPTTQAALRVAARRLGSRAVRAAPSGGAQPENDAR